MKKNPFNLLNPLLISTHPYNLCASVGEYLSRGSTA